MSHDYFFNAISGVGVSRTLREHPTLLSNEIVYVFNMRLLHSSMSSNKYTVKRKKYCQNFFSTLLLCKLLILFLDEVDTNVHPFL